MVVLIDRRVIAKEVEVVGVAPIAEGRHGMAAELLSRSGKPALGPLPRRIVAVKLVGAEGTVACGKQQIGDAEPRT